MCLECGCGEANAAKEHHHDGHVHTHADGTTHSHSHHHHDHDHVHDHDHEHHDHEHTREPTRKTIELEQNILAQNDAIAAENRAWLAERQVIAVNLISSPGTGKTLLLEKTLERLRDHVACAVIAGDQQTDNDARRLQGKGARVVQIETQSACHLDAQRVKSVLPEVVTKDTRLLFIENVGNLVCPAAFDLGEHFKIALLSTTEGEDKPLKYPALFAAAQVVILTK
ncbi:MAG: hydrogenase accessory protein HypB, partial [Spartobacteria bacterium]|nr:hydrogenase accessory protein HypB [Spartobacteria bacterium]